MIGVGQGIRSYVNISYGGVDYMKNLIKDKRSIFLIAGIMINAFMIYIVSFSNLRGWGSTELQFVYFIATISLLVLGELDILRNYERVKERFMLSIVRGLIAMAFLCAVLDYTATAAYAFFANIFMWWIMLFLVIKVLYSGYYAPIRKWVAAFPIVMSVITIYFISYVSKSIGIVISEFLILLPLFLLVYINIKYFGHLRTKDKKIMALAYIIFGLMMIATELSFLYMMIVGKQEQIGLGYDGIFSLLLVIYTLLISFNISMREGRILRNYRYTALMAVALVSAATLLGTMLNSIKGVALGILLSITLILVEELAAMLFKSGTALEKHKTVVEKHAYDIAQKKKMASFLHDEILQDLYAIKLLLDSPDSKDDVKEAINELAYRVRLEMEEYSVRLEKSISYKENLVNLFEMIKKRYPMKRVDVELFCDEQLHLFQPFDEMIYVILRELVTNVYKHSNGDLCHVTLQRVQNALILEVEDNGFNGHGNLLDAYNSGHGIMRIQEILEFYNSELYFEKNDNGGAKARIVIADITKGM